MKRVTGIGGIFFKAKDPEKLKAWYRTHLGIESESWGAVFHWREDPRSADAATAWNTTSLDQLHQRGMSDCRMGIWRVSFT